MSSDEELKARVTAEIARDPNLAGAEVAVIVKEGVVTVVGHMDTIAHKEAVQRAVRYACGVCGVAFELDAKAEFGHRTSDSEIAHAALAALRANHRIAGENVGVEVENGWVILWGELGSHVDVEFARQCVARVLGVRGLCCRISVAPATGMTPARPPASKLCAS